MPNSLVLHPSRTVIWSSVGLPLISVGVSGDESKGGWTSQTPNTESPDPSVCSFGTYRLDCIPTDPEVVHSFRCVLVQRSGSCLFCGTFFNTNSTFTISGGNKDSAWHAILPHLRDRGL